MVVGNVDAEKTSHVGPVFGSRLRDSVLQFHWRRLHMRRISRWFRWRRPRGLLCRGFEDISGEKWDCSEYRPFGITCAYPTRKLNEINIVKNLSVNCGKSTGLSGKVFPRENPRVFGQLCGELSEGFQWNVRRQAQGGRPRVCMRKVPKTHFASYRRGDLEHMREAAP